MQRPLLRQIRSDNKQGAQGGVKGELQGAAQVGFLLQYTGQCGALRRHHGPGFWPNGCGNCTCLNLLTRLKRERTHTDLPLRIDFTLKQHGLTHETSYKLGHRSFVQIFRRARLRNGARVHHNDLIADSQRFTLIVGDISDR